MDLLEQMGADERRAAAAEWRRWAEEDEEEARNASNPLTRSSARRRAHGCRERARFEEHVADGGIPETFEEIPFEGGK